MYDLIPQRWNFILHALKERCLKSSRVFDQVLKSDSGVHVCCAGSFWIIPMAGLLILNTPNGHLWVVPGYLLFFLVCHHLGSLACCSPWDGSQTWLSNWTPTHCQMSHSFFLNKKKFSIARYLLDNIVLISAIHQYESQVSCSEKSFWKVNFIFMFRS